MCSGCALSISTYTLNWACVMWNQHILFKDHLLSGSWHHVFLENQWGKWIMLSSLHYSYISLLIRQSYNSRSTVLFSIKMFMFYICFIHSFILHEQLGLSSCSQSPLPLLTLQWFKNLKDLNSPSPFPLCS